MLTDNSKMYNESRSNNTNFETLINKIEDLEDSLVVLKMRINQQEHENELSTMQV